MSRPFKQWTVLPHGKLSQVGDNILTVVGELHMPLMDLPRRMTVVRLRDGRLVVYSAIALDDDEMLALEHYGRLAYLVVPSDIHRMDARIWKDRYPDMHVATTPGARDKAQEIVEVDAIEPDFGDPNVRFVTVPGTREREAALVVMGAHGTTLVLNDLVGNIRHESGFGGWLLRMAGFAGDEAKIPSVVRLALIKDKEALRQQLLQWADIATLKRIVVSHGAIIDEHPRQVLRELAGTLA